MEDKEIKLSKRILYMMFAVVAAFLMIVLKVSVRFGASSGVYYGIMSLLIYGLAFAGVAVSFLGEKNATPEFWLNACVFVLAMFVI